MLLLSSAAHELKPASEAMVYTAASPVSADQAAVLATAQQQHVLDANVGDVVDMQPVQPFVQVSQSLQRAAHKKGKCISKNKIVDCDGQHSAYAGGSR